MAMQSYFPSSSNLTMIMNGKKDTVSASLSSSGSSGANKFPHTRAQLSAIARQHKPSETYDSDAETEDYSKAPQSLVNKVVSLLVDEREDELKMLLKTTYNMDDESAGIELIYAEFVINIFSIRFATG